MQFFYWMMKLLHFVFLFTDKSSKQMDDYMCMKNETVNNQSCEWCTGQTCKEDCMQNKNYSGQITGIADLCNANDYRNFTYNADEAFKLALFSAIAYSDEPGKCLRELFPKKDYTLFYVYLRNCDDYVFTYDKQCSAFATLSHRNQEIIVAFRGTRGVKQIIDQMLITLGTPSVSSAVGGKVQRYFNNVYEKFYFNIKHLIKDLNQWFPMYVVKLTGHSLGGTAASITSAMLVKDKVLKPDQILLYTFGMPKVGNKEYAEAFNRLVPHSWRVVRGGDSVARLPFCSLAICSLFSEPYHHETKVLYSGTEMDKYSEYIICDEKHDPQSKCKEKRKKRGGLNHLTKKHKIYFGIPIGTYCRDHVLKK